ncbi:thioredoxin family protein [Pseudodesulfovibrio piezophilus]|uniref:Thioredoxin domain protein n=1 Tax=Pseudodesulfovibrio piezophilus (strain DSM 21447 / JCM 15486 / C1TLV30) TaxID=1322246 RepID=M1WMG8_PSEP2|nr:thioredoxin domain-containing protein [Pseudodesulfovibrio piezophilus]CCH49580.1 Thioredoxin domain protein [Pseudodesulfovibrio piezophilus C1TLV30]
MTPSTDLIVCPACRAINRVQAGREAQATCGKCGGKVYEPHVLELVGMTFDRHIAKTGIPVLVDFYSPTCGPCLMMGPQFEEAARLLYPSVRFGRIDTSAEHSVAARFDIMSVPTLVLFKNGREIARQPGAMNAHDIVAWARKNL